LAGDCDDANDVDILISRRVCRQYWEFLRILHERGIRSLHNVDPEPDDSHRKVKWKPCDDLDVRHAFSLKLPECGTAKSYNLDICYRVAM